MPPLELIRPDMPRGRFRLALFDFDGTLSLIREGWPTVMAGLVREVLDSDDPAIIDEIVVGLNGKPAVVQMTRLALEYARRGGTPLEPVAYLREYDARLLAMSASRYDDLTTGRVPASAWAVPGSHHFLAELRSRDLRLALASGTQIAHVRRELDLLRLGEFFGDAVYAPDGDDPHFAKRDVIERLVADHSIGGDELIGFGDGVVETEEVKRAGGVAVAVASEEPPRRGVNPQKRERLIRAGADAVIADYTEHDRLARWLFDGT